MEKKTYQITFMAELTEETAEKLKTNFYGVMLFELGISPTWNLKLEEVNLNSCDTNPEDTEEPSPEATPSLLEKLLLKPMLCIRHVERCFEVCKSKNARDEESAEMVDVIIRNKVFDFGYTHFYNLNMPCATVIQTALNNGSASITRDITKSEKNTKKNLKKFYEQYGYEFYE